MKILIVGAGAMGSVFGGFLSRDHEVTLVGRDPHIVEIKKHGLTVSGVFGDYNFRDLEAVTSIRGVESRDLILITTKSYDTKKAVEQIAGLVGEDTKVVSVQNGIGNEDIISKIVGREHTMGCMAIFGAAIPEPGHVKVTVYASECLVGCVGGVGGAGGVGDEKWAAKVADAFSNAGIPALPTDDIIREKWMKAFYNIGLNPLSAILKVPYGDLKEHDETRVIMKKLIDEAFKVAAAVGVKLKLDNDEYFEYFLEKQIPPTARHKSSMLQDIERGKRTEIDYLNGAIVSMGKRYKIETPVNETITNVVKMLEKLEK